MAFDVTKAREILVYVPVVSATVAIPCLTVLAYRSWSRRWQRDLPRWRGTLGTISIAATFLGWVTFVGSFLMIALGFHQQIDSLLFLRVTSQTTVAGIALAFTLRGPARAQTLFSGLLMILLLWISTNV